MGMRAFLIGSSTVAHSAAAIAGAITAEPSAAVAMGISSAASVAAGVRIVLNRIDSIPFRLARLTARSYSPGSALPQLRSLASIEGF